MISIRELEEHFASLQPELLDIVVEVRNLVAQVAPAACEVIRREGLVYFDAQKGGPVSAGICQILICSDQIRLAFIRGEDGICLPQLIFAHHVHLRVRFLVSFNQLVRPIEARVLEIVFAKFDFGHAEKSNFHESCNCKGSIVDVWRLSSN